MANTLRGLLALAVTLLLAVQPSLSRPARGADARAGTSAVSGAATTTLCTPGRDGRQIARISGEDRVLTAVLLAQRLWPVADTVVLASAATYPDALAAAPLAIRRNAPMLLTLPDRLPDAVRAELERLRVTTVFVAGGAAAVSDTVLQQVRATVHRPAVHRIGGRDRYETAARLAEAAGASATGEAVVTTAVRFPDALSAGALAATPHHLPIVLTPHDTLHRDAAAALQALDVTDVVIVGGHASVSEDVAAQLRAQGLAVRRLSGADRYATAAQVAGEAARRVEASGALVASGEAFADGLVAAPAAARTRALLTLVPPRVLETAGPVVEVLRRHGPELECSVITGGVAAVGPTVAFELGRVLAVTWPVTTTIVAAGDIASCGREGDEATAALLDRLDGVVATTGDNVYERGTTEEFANCYTPSWGRHRARTRPSPGNHEYGTPGAQPYFAYFGSATEPGWYSYDVGPWWHAISLNSNCNVVACQAGSQQEQWLRADLAAHRDRHVVAYWHHPRFSSGDHGDNPSVAALWQALEDAGADVVLAGHDHDYERFAPQDSTGAHDTGGIRQFVVGTGGRSLYPFPGPPKPTTEFRDDSTFGVLVLHLEQGGYRWAFIGTDGTVRDEGATTITP